MRGASLSGLCGDGREGQVAVADEIPDFGEAGLPQDCSDGSPDGLTEAVLQRTGRHSRFRGQFSDAQIESQGFLNTRKGLRDKGIFGMVVACGFASDDLADAVDERRVECEPMCGVELADVVVDSGGRFPG